MSPSSFLLALSHLRGTSRNLPQFLELLRKVEQPMRDYIVTYEILGLWSLGFRYNPPWSSDAAGFEIPSYEDFLWEINESEIALIYFSDIVLVGFDSAGTGDPIVIEIPSGRVLLLDHEVASHTNPFENATILSESTEEFAASLRPW